MMTPMTAPPATHHSITSHEKRWSGADGSGSADEAGTEAANEGSLEAWDVSDSSPVETALFIWAGGLRSVEALRPRERGLSMTSLHLIRGERLPRLGCSVKRENQQSN